MLGALHQLRLSRLWIMHRCYSDLLKRQNQTSNVRQQGWWRDKQRQAPHPLSNRRHVRQSGAPASCVRNAVNVPEYVQTGRRSGLRHSLIPKREKMIVVAHTHSTTVPTHFTTCWQHRPCKQRRVDAPHRQGQGRASSSSLSYASCKKDMHIFTSSKCFIV